MSVDVGVWKRGEKVKSFRRWIFWPVLIALIGVLVVCSAMVIPRWLGYDHRLENAMVTVKIFDAPDTRPQVTAGLGDEKVSAKPPDWTTRGKDGSADVPLYKVVDPKDGSIFANKYAVVRNAQIQRVLGDDVITVGTSPDDEIFVHIPKDARLTNSHEWGPRLDPKAQVNVVGYLRPLPPIDRARELLRVKNLGLENKPLPPLYIEATAFAWWRRNRCLAITRQIRNLLRPH